MNTTFHTTGLAGMTDVSFIGMITIMIFVGFIALVLLGVAISAARESRRLRSGTWNRRDYIDLVDEEDVYDSRENPTSGSGFRRRYNDLSALPSYEDQPSQDPAGYWRTARRSEQPIHMTRGYRLDPTARRPLGLLEPDVPPRAIANVPTSPAMYPVTRVEVERVVPRSPMLPPHAPAPWEAPISTTYAAYAPGYDPSLAPVSPSPYFQPLDVRQVYIDAPTSPAPKLGRHSDLVAPGTEAQRAALKRALGDRTRQIPVIDMKELCAA